MSKSPLAKIIIGTAVSFIPVSCVPKPTDADHRTETVLAKTTVFFDSAHSVGAGGAASVNRTPNSGTFTVNSLISTDAQPSDTSTSYVLLNPAQNAVKLADRFYLSSVLMQIFGPASAPLIASLINNNAEALGAPCDPYGHPGVFDCPITASYSQAPVNPVSTASRGAYLTRACEGITVIDPAVLFAAAQITAVDITTVPPADSDVDNLYGLFSPFRAPTATEHAALMTLVQATLALPNISPISAWRHVLLATCLSPRWQLY